MNNELQNRYKDLFADNLSKLETLEKKESLSAPFLLNPNPNFYTQKRRIMFVGKETNHWLTHESRPLNKRGLNYFLKHKDEAFDVLMKRYKKTMQDIETSDKSSFFRAYKFFKEALSDDKKGSIIWNNLYLCSYDQNKGFSKNAKNHSFELTEISKRFFLEEIHTLKPDILIFVTGSSYDNIIKYFFKDKIENSQVMIKRRVWKFTYNGIQCYRTIHPHYQQMIKNKEANYYEQIVDDI